MSFVNFRNTNREVKVFDFRLSDPYYQILVPRESSDAAPEDQHR